MTWGWNREGLKGNAKACLKNYYALAIVATLVYLVCCWAASIPGSMLSSILSVQSIFSSIADIGPNGEYYFDFDFGAYCLSLVRNILIQYVFLIPLTIFLLNPLAVGFIRFFLEPRWGIPANIKSLFFAFRGDRYWNIVKVTFLMSLKSFLWGLLFVFPGIIKQLEYSQILPLLAENPDLPADRCFTISKGMTDGSKSDIFVLYLSFIGWILLGSLACGFGIVFVYPYINATMAELYMFYRYHAVGMGIAAAHELPGPGQVPPDQGQYGM